MLNPSQKTMIPFLMAGYPTLEASEILIAAVIEEGAIVVEVGLPFSDPMADGPTIQEASRVALKQKTDLAQVFKMISRLKVRFPGVKFVLFTYLNPLLQFGLDHYVSEGKRHGVSATLTVDLPPEEAGHYLALHERADLKTVFLSSPTTSRDRLRQVAKASTGFIYHVSRAGVTGAKSDLDRDLPSQLQDLQKLDLGRAVAVGFGISTPAQVLDVARHAQAAVVGSRLLNLIKESASLEAAESELRRFTRLSFEGLNKELN